jgi:hypothetical protein
VPPAKGVTRRRRRQTGANVRRPAIIAIFLLAIGIVSCGKPYRFGSKSGFRLGKQEMVFVRIVQDAQGNCKLADRTPSEIRTDSDDRNGPGKITWEIEGTCTNSTIAIAPEFTRKGRAYKIVAGLTPKGVAASDGEKITATVIPNLPEDQKKGHYAFTILINGKEAEYASPADRGSFFLCPIWPCGDFDSY